MDPGDRVSNGYLTPPGRAVESFLKKRGRVRQQRRFPLEHMNINIVLPLRQRSGRVLASIFACAALALAALLTVPSTATAQQTLYVVDNGTTIYKIAPDGTQTTFASGLGAVGPIALDAAGNVYAGYASASGYGGGIMRFAPDGTQINFTGYPIIANTTGLAFDGSGHLFEAEYGTDSNNNSTIHEITQGGVVSSFAQVIGSQRNLAFDATGNLYVADTGLNTVTKIAPNGTEITFATGLSSPYGLAFDASGNLYVANNGNNSGIAVTKIAPDGTQSTFATGLAEPAGLAFDQNGNLFVSNSGGTTITEITPAGATSTFATGFTSPTGLAFSAPTAPTITSIPNAVASVGTPYSYQIAAANSPGSYSAIGLPAGLNFDTTTGLIYGTPTAGGAYTVSLFATNAYGTGSGILTLAISPGALQQTLYVTDDGSNSIIEVAPNGTQSTFSTGFAGGVALIFDGAGNLYVGVGSASGYGGNINRIAPDGTVGDFAGYPNVADPNGLVFDGSGNLFESEVEGDTTHPATIHKITPDGTVSNFTTLAYSLAGLGFDSQGNLFVADTGESTVIKIAPDGTQTSFATVVDEPDGLAIDASDNVYVANNANGFGLTISKITPTGVVSTFATGLAAPTGLTFDAYGNLYVANGATHGGGTITEITSAGAKGTFAAGLTSPNGLVFSALPVPVVTSATRASVAVGTSFTYQIMATNAPTSYSATGLPAGLTCDAASGLISGTVTQIGTFTISLFATNTGGAGSGILTLTVTAASSTPTPTPTATPTPSPTPTPTATPTPTPVASVPGIVITSPPDGITVVVGESVPLAASITDADSTIVTVQFLVNGVVVGTSSASGPFTASAPAPAAGTYALSAVATDALGRTFSGVVHVTVIAADPANPAPTANLLTPLNARDIASDATLTLTATADSASPAGLDHVSILVNGETIATFDALGNPITTTNAHPTGGSGRTTPVRQDAASTPLSKLFSTTYQMPGLDKILTMIVTATDKLNHTSVSPVTSFHSKVTTDRAPLVSFANASALAKVLVGSLNPGEHHRQRPRCERHQQRGGQGAGAPGRGQRRDAGGVGVLDQRGAGGPGRGQFDAQLLLYPAHHRQVRLPRRGHRWLGPGDGERPHHPGGGRGAGGGDGRDLGRWAGAAGGGERQGGHPAHGRSKPALERALQGGGLGGGGHEPQGGGR